VAKTPEQEMDGPSTPEAGGAPAAQAAGKVFNVATGRRVTLNETFKLLQPLTSYSGSPAYAAERGGDIKHSLADISLAEQHLGYTPKVNFEEGLQRTVEWYRSQEKAGDARTPVLKTSRS